MSKSVVVAIRIGLVVFAAGVIACGGDDKGGLLSGNQPASQSQTNPGGAAPDVARQPAQQPAGQPPAQPPSGQPGASIADACTLLTRQDATAILGGAAVSEGKSLPAIQQNMGTFTASITACTYDGTSGPAASVNLQMWKAVGTSGPAVQQMGGIVCGSKEKISGIGDTACWYNAEHKELQAFKGASFVSVTVRGAPGNLDDAIKALAKKIVDKVQ